MTLKVILWTSEDERELRMFKRFNNVNFLVSINFHFHFKSKGEWRSHRRLQARLVLEVEE